MSTTIQRVYSFFLSYYSLSLHAYLWDNYKQKTKGITAIYLSCHTRHMIPLQLCYFKRIFFLQQIIKEGSSKQQYQYTISILPLKHVEGRVNFKFVKKRSLLRDGQNLSKKISNLKCRRNVSRRDNTGVDLILTCLNRS